MRTKFFIVRGLDASRLCGETLGGVGFDAPRGGVRFDSSGRVVGCASKAGKEAKLELAPCRGVGQTCRLTKGASPE